jgi:hypothetical protein
VQGNARKKALSGAKKHFNKIVSDGKKLFVL